MSKEKKYFLGNKSLSSFPTEGEKFCHFDKEDLEDKTRELGKDLASLQELLYAQNKYKILIVLQGLDTSGKDGTVKHVFGATNPQGVRVVSFKKPSELEASHDFLWRIHKEVPSTGELVIFNRSHYEDYVVPAAHDLLPKKQLERRLDHLAHFEQMLIDNDVILLKFFLHISRKEQAKRLNERLDDPSKHLKFNLSDLSERQFWKSYQKAYDTAIRATHTKDLPWYIIPADSKSIRNYTISKILVERLSALKPEPQPMDPKALRRVIAEAKKILK